MPSPGTIVEGLRAIANDAIALAVVWHVLLAAACIALALGWRPSQRTAAAVLSVPIASVSALAFRHGNPFNGLMFAVIAVVLLGLAVRLAPGPVQRGGVAMTGGGILMIAFAWLYPHFLDPRSPAIYIVAAPTGLIPCPTLSLLIGFTLLAGGFGSRAWTLVVVAAGLFYGVFGVARLGVRLDVVLAAGGLFLLVLFRSRRAARKTIASHA
jgi:hypothetical protein